MRYCAFHLTPLAVRQALSKLYAGKAWQVKEGNYQIPYIFTVWHIANHFELPETTANYLLDQLIVEGYIKVRKEDKEFFVLFPIDK